MKFSIKVALTLLLSIFCVAAFAQKNTMIKGKIYNNTFEKATLKVVHNPQSAIYGEANIAEDGTFLIKTNKITEPDIYVLEFAEKMSSLLVILPGDQIEIEWDGANLQRIIAVSGSSDMAFVKKMSDYYDDLKRIGDSINGKFLEDPSIKYYKEFHTKFQMFYQINSGLDSAIQTSMASYALLRQKLQENNKGGKMNVKDSDAFLAEMLDLLKSVDNGYTPLENYQKNVTSYYDFAHDDKDLDPHFTAVLDEYLSSTTLKFNLAAEEYAFVMPTIRKVIAKRDSLMFEDQLSSKKQTKAFIQYIYDECHQFQDFSNVLNRVNVLAAQTQQSGKGMHELSQQMTQKKVKMYQTAFSQKTGGINLLLKETLLAHKDGLAALMFIDLFPKDQFADLHKQVVSSLKAKYPNNVLVNDRAKALNNVKIAVGSEAPDLAFQNPEGKIMKLSDLKGKVVLLDFWASWCRPCRMENPNVVKLYNKYKSQGFDVYSVSLDRTKQQWVDAIAKDKLIWPNHVSDLKGWQSEGAKQYKVTSIPSTFLIDRNGKIIAVNPRGQQLEKALKEVFGK